MHLKLAILVLLAGNPLAVGSSDQKGTPFSECVLGLYSHALQSLVVRRSKGVLTEADMKDVRSLDSRKKFLEKELALLPTKGRDVNRSQIAEYQMELSRIRPLLRTYTSLTEEVLDQERFLAGLVGELSKEQSEDLTEFAADIAHLADWLHEGLAKLQESSTSAYRNLEGVLLLNRLISESKKSMTAIAKQVGISRETLNSFCMGVQPIWSSSLARDLAQALDSEANDLLSAWSLPNGPEGASERMDRVMRKQGIKNSAVAKALEISSTFVQLLRGSKTSESSWNTHYEKAFAFLGIKEFTRDAAPVTRVIPDDKALALGSSTLSLLVEGSEKTISQLRRALGWNDDRLTHILDGTQWARLHEIYQICDFLKVPAAEVLAAYGYPRNTFESNAAYTEAVCIETRRISGE